MYSSPKNKFIEKLIKKLHNYDNKNYNNIYDNMEVAGPAFLTNNYTENKDTILLENKVVTNKNKNFYNNIYGIHLCDNNWVK
jgi:hypothetical protein